MPEPVFVRAAVLVLLAFLGLGCWFPGNPTGRSSNDETPACPSQFPVGKPCDANKLRVCRDRNEHYECFEGQWHNL